MSIGRPFVVRAGRDLIGLLLTGDTDREEVHELVSESYRAPAPKRLTVRLASGCQIRSDRGLDTPKEPEGLEQLTVAIPAYNCVRRWHPHRQALDLDEWFRVHMRSQDHRVRIRYYSCLSVSARSGLTMDAR